MLLLLKSTWYVIRIRYTMYIHTDSLPLHEREHIFDRTYTIKDLICHLNLNLGFQRGNTMFICCQNLFEFNQEILECFQNRVDWKNLVWSHFECRLWSHICLRHIVSTYLSLMAILYNIVAYEVPKKLNNSMFKMFRYYKNWYFFLRKLSHWIACSNFDVPCKELSFARP